MQRFERKFFVLNAIAVIFAACMIQKVHPRLPVLNVSVRVRPEIVASIARYLAYYPFESNTLDPSTSAAVIS